MKTAIENPTLATTRVRRPFLHIEPSVSELPDSARACLPTLQRLVGDDVPALVKGLVEFALSHRTGNVAPSVGSINRRRRVARQWIQSILAGETDAVTVHAISHAYIPQLAGGGPEVHLGAEVGLRCIEYLRGAITARIFDAPAASLVPEAKALHAAESVLAIHLAAYHVAAAKSAAAAAEVH